MSEPGPPPSPHVRHAIGPAFERLASLMATLRAECPWDRVQTHASLRRHLLEEAHEVLEALDAVALIDDGLDPAAAAAASHLAEELGDLLFQVVFHAHLAAEAGRFTLADVATGVHDKLVARHPHIFDPDHDAASAVGWEQAKVAEKGRGSVMDGIPSTLPALALAAKVVSKATAVDPSLVEAVRADGEGIVPGASGAGDDGDAFGRALLALVARARVAGVDAESALRVAANQLAAQVRDREASTDGTTGA